jgi:hypothetical protein
MHSGNSNSGNSRRGKLITTEEVDASAGAAPSAEAEGCESLAGVVLSLDFCRTSFQVAARTNSHKTLPKRKLNVDIPERLRRFAIETFVCGRFEGIIMASILFCGKISVSRFGGVDLTGFHNPKRQ